MSNKIQFVVDAWCVNERSRYEPRWQAEVWFGKTLVWTDDQYEISREQALRYGEKRFASKLRDLLNP